MRSARRRILGLAGVGILIVTFYFLGVNLRTARAQVKGDTVVFIVRAGSDITQGSGGDLAIYVAQPSGSTDARVCVPETDTALRPVQSVVFLDPGSGSRTTRLSGLITISVNGIPQTTPIANGTRVGNLTLACPASPCCGIRGDNYDTYSGVVQ